MSFIMIVIVLRVKVARDIISNAMKPKVMDSLTLLES